MKDTEFKEKCVKGFGKIGMELYEIAGWLVEKDRCDWETSGAEDILLEDEGLEWLSDEAEEYIEEHDDFEAEKADLYNYAEELLEEYCLSKLNSK